MSFGPGGIVVEIGRGRVDSLRGNGDNDHNHYVPVAPIWSTALPC